MKLLLVFCSLTAMPTTDEIVAAWKRNAGEVESAVLELQVERDSRDGTFGHASPPANRPVIQLHFDDSLRRIDAPRRTAIRRDGRTGPAESDPDRARVEFRNVLLEERLAGPQMVPRLRPASLMVDAAGQRYGQSLAPLDQLAAEAPLWAVRTLWMVDPQQLAASTDVNQASDARSLGLLARPGTDSETWLQVEPQPPHRPLRVVKRDKARPLAQLDFDYSGPQAVIPARWFVQTLGSAGEPLDFAVVALGRVEPLPQPLAESLQTLQRLPNSDQPQLPPASTVRVRSVLRQTLDSRWLPAAAIALLLLAGLRPPRSATKTNRDA